MDAFIKTSIRQPSQTLYIEGKMPQIAPRLKIPAAFAHLSVANRKQDPGEGQKIKFVNPNTDNYEDNICSAAARCLPMPVKGDIAGKTAIICGSGPSLRDIEVSAKLVELVDQGAVVFACKAAIKFLDEYVSAPDYGVSMDPGAHIADPRKIYKAPGVKHIIASTSDPDLFDYLLGADHGDPAEVMIFHSACGFSKAITREEYDALPEERQIYYQRMPEADGYYTDENLMYTALFPDNAVMGGGFNVTNRAVSLALYMGAERIVLAGVDAGWRDGDEMYVDGPAHRPGQDMTDKGLVDGTNWNTRPDMLASAVAIAKLAKKMGPDKFEILGDTLPAALVGKDDEFLSKVASF